ncbi:uncharacterized protein LOC116108917 [Pistacia vera]|uniref:uncharacterized protein LOC116108917 n=1 Tax=Pistacia vera TaxID=55513 RepID=UPI001262F0F8|nr:uncharacterized protein LOC116108917 [Pistacia vera]
MEYFAPEILDDGRRIRVIPPKEVADLGRDKWGNCLVGFFLGRRLPFSLVKGFIDRNWKCFGKVCVVSNGVGGFIMKFDNESSKDEALEGGPWHIGGQPLFLKKWRPNLKMAGEGISSVPIWVKFSGVPLEFWTAKGFSYVASAIGKPLYMDNITDAGDRLEYGRVCVEIDTASSFPNLVELGLLNGDGVNIRVEYFWKPRACPLCRTFGHNLKEVL